MSEAIDYERLAEAVAVRLAKAPPFELVVWSGKECAEYLKVSRAQFMDRTSKHHEFPAALRMPTESGGGGHPRWFARDVIAWLAKQKG